MAVVGNLPVFYSPPCISCVNLDKSSNGGIWNGVSYPGRRLEILGDLETWIAPRVLSIQITACSEGLSTLITREQFFVCVIVLWDCLCVHICSCHVNKSTASAQRVCTWWFKWLLWANYLPQCEQTYGFSPVCEISYVVVDDLYIKIYATTFRI